MTYLYNTSKPRTKVHLMNPATKAAWCGYDFGMLKVYAIAEAMPKGREICKNCRDTEQLGCRAAMMQMRSGR